MVLKYRYRLLAHNKNIYNLGEYHYGTNYGRRFEKGRYVPL